MTSLVLFQAENGRENVLENFDWGTGKERRRTGSPANFDHAPGTYLYTGDRGAQIYRSTDITLSNVRINDELVPPPQRTSALSSQQIPLKFPSNHPFASHISQKALFPNADFSRNDRPSTDQEPYFVTHKIRGNPYRREVHFPGLVQQERSKWPDKQIMQLPRSVSDVGATSIYPWPRKIFQPNEENPSGIMRESKPKTNYQAAYSSTRENYEPTAEQSNHRVPSGLERARYSLIEPIKVMSLDEHLDDQLRNGTDYVNLPADQFPTALAPTWIPRTEPANSEAHPKEELRFLHYLEPSTEIPQLVRDRHHSHQQIEVDNRLQELEAIRPQDNIRLLNLKYQNLQKSTDNRPLLPQYSDQYIQTFYDQTGRYIQERSGLYHTENYDPTAMLELANEEDEQRANPSQPMGVRFPSDFSRLVKTLRAPGDARVQEGQWNPFIQRESVYGQSYNTRKFLQENSLSPTARLDPTRLISTRYNTDLERVRGANSHPIKSTPNQIDEQPQPNPSEDIILGPFLPPAPYTELYSTNYITEQTNGYSRRSTARVYDSPFKSQQDTLAYKHHPQPPPIPIPTYPQHTTQLPTAAKLTLALPGPELVTRSLDFKSPAHSTYQRSYKDTAFYPVRPAMPSARRFSEEEHSQSKQWTLGDLQDRWSKTRAQQEYHFDHPEPVPYVGDGTLRAKKEILLADILDRQRQMTVR